MSEDVLATGRIGRCVVFVLLFSSNVYVEYGPHHPSEDCKDAL